MVERIFAKQKFATGLVEGDQTRDHFARRHGFRECDGFLVDNTACPGLNGNVWQPYLFDAAFITKAEIDSLCAAQVRGQASDENVVIRGHSALDAASR